MRRLRIGALLGAFVLMFGVASAALATSAGVGSIQGASLTTSSNHGNGQCDNGSGVSGDSSIKTFGAYGQTGQQGDKGDKGDKGGKCDPAIAIDKTADPTTLPAGGGSVTYTYVVTNTGDVPLVDVVVTDDKCAPVTGPAAGGDANSDGKLDLTETWTYSCTTTLTATTTNIGTVNADWIDCSKAEGDGSHPSGDASVQTTGKTHMGDGNGDDGNGGDNDDDDTCVTKSVPPASDSATVTVATPAPQPAVAIDKTADPTTLPAGGGSVTYTYVVTNTGTVAVQDVVVTDDTCSPVTGPAAGGDANSNNRLDLTESWTYTCTMTLTATTTNIGTVNANWDSCNDDCLVPVPPATDSATVTVALPATQPGISIDKTADPTALDVEGGSSTYTYVVTNTGNVGLTAVAVWDDNGTPVDTTDDFQPTCPATTLDAGASMTCTALVTGIAVTVTNIATVTANVVDSSDIVTATDSATVTVATNGGGVGGETNVPVVTAPPTDTLNKTTSDPGSTLPLILIVLGIIGFAAVVLTPGRTRR